MPVDWSLYPKNWRDLVAQVRARSRDVCECRGQCGRARCQTGCGAINKQPHPVTGSRVVLTTAHLDHNTTHNDLSNLLHLCQSCHLHLDRHQHGANARATVQARQAQVMREAGQGALFAEPESDS
ncbi:MAG: hypothetical protein EOO70_03335 [Myxococcaceae bacterium]|nr:MAG: hypothetical protein EOO70_03335 [Myxococcaceae bacterium]